MARPQRGDELTLTIDSLAYGGAGVARTESGYVVFVSGGMPGDTVRAVVGKRKRSYAEARALEIISPGPDRIEPVADHPGAPWQVLAYERQLEIKTEQVRDALTRIGGFEDLTLEPIVPAEQQWRYRNKLEYSFGTGPDGELVCGFHAPGNWEEIVPLTDCLLASEAGNAVRERIVQWCREQGLTAYDRRTNVGFLRNLVVREGRRTGALQARLVTSDDADGLDREALVAAVGDDLKGLSVDAHRLRRRDDPGRHHRGPGGIDALPRGDRRHDASGSPPRRSSRRTPRWPSGCTRSRPSTRGPAASSGSTTSTAGSGRSDC